MALKSRVPRISMGGGSELELQTKGQLNRSGMAGGGRQVQQGGDIRIHIADSLCVYQKLIQHYKAVILHFLNLLFIYLVVLGLSCSMWDLVPKAAVEHRPPALGAQRLPPGKSLQLKKKKNLIEKRTTLPYSRNQHNIVNQVHFNKNFLKKKQKSCKKACFLSLCLLPCKDTRKRQPSVNQEAGLHDTVCCLSSS